MRRPTILTGRPSSDWIGRLAQLHKQFFALAASDDETNQIQQRIEIDFVSSSLTLEGLRVEEAQVARLASTSIDIDTLSEAERLIVRQIEAFRAVASLAHQKAQGDLLTLESLLKLRSEEGLRRSEGDASRAILPPRPEHLAATIRSACFWFSAESFLELNPVEQSAIALLRLIEIQPFDDRNDSTALAASSLFLIRNHLPPVIVRADRIPAYRSAVEESCESNTRPMVELIAEATERTLGEMITLVTSRR
jgi:Fic family protein